MNKIFNQSSNDEESNINDGRTIGVFLGKLKSIYKAENLNVTIILDDPSGNSYLQVKNISPHI